MHIVQSQQQVEVQHRYELQRQQRWQVQSAPAPEPVEVEAVFAQRSAQAPPASRISRQNLVDVSRLQQQSSSLRLEGRPLTDFLQETRWQLQLLASTLHQLTGRPISLQPQPLLLTPEQFSAPAPLQSQAPLKIQTATQIQMSEPGTRLQLQERVSEFEQLSARFSGQVATADGGQQRFEVELKLERAIEGVAWRDVQLQDPLVIQLDNQPLSLSEERFAFDLTSDGAEELIPKLGAGYGLLALDRNQDGQINNGSELFGAQTGNGFAELAEFDEDGNGFIDSGDSVYQHLLVWKDPGNGDEPQLLGLAEVGVDAISLQAVATPFRLTDSLGESLGQLRSSAVTLGDSARFIHQIDFAL